MKDDMRLDDPMGPEFSVRIMSRCAMYGVETVGQLRAKLDELHRWKGMGHKSINEIKEFFRHLDAPVKDLFADPEYVAYRFEDGIMAAEALLADVTRTLMRAALKGRVSKDTRNHMRLKLIDAAERVSGLPSIEETRGS